MLETILKITLVIFMVGNLFDMGLRLKPSEAMRGLRDPRFVGYTLLWGFVLLPGLAWAIAQTFPIAHPYATGLILLGMAPCAPFLPPMVDRARADIGQAAALMLLTAVVTVLYLPLAVPRLTSGLNADAWTIARPLVFFLLLPLAVGMAWRHFFAPQAERLQPLVKRITGFDTLVMLVLCVAVYGKGFLSLAGSHAIGAQIVFFAAATMLPYVLSFGLPRGERVVISLGMATRNLGAAFAPLFAIPGADHRAIVMVALGVLMQAAFAFAAANVYRRSQQAAAQSGH